MLSVRRPAGLLTALSTFGAPMAVERESSGGRSEHSDQAYQATAIGNAITRLHRDRYGRGATTTRTVFQRNHVVAKSRVGM
jgi:hypothetical protein